MTMYASPIAPYVPPAPARRHRSVTSWVVDLVVGGALWAALALVSIGAVYMSIFFVMAGDGCYSAEACPEQELIGTGIVTVWAGAAFALVIALVGSIVSLIRRRCLWYWPLVGIPVVVLATWIGAELASRGGGLS